MNQKHSVLGAQKGAVARKSILDVHNFYKKLYNIIFP